MTRCIAGFAGLLLIALPLEARTRPPVWNWDFPQIEATVTKVRTGRDLTPKRWPNGALSFDMDAETGFLRSGADTPQPLSRGEYGPRVGVPRILRMLEKYRVPATFFVPAVSGQPHPDTVDAILKTPVKHEIAVGSRAGAVVP